jgi:rhodanese-related sulfurtransferase
MKKLNFITIEKLLEMQANHENFKLVEVLSEEKYKEGHIPGSINIPFDKLEIMARAHLQKTDTVVVYCSGYSCHASTKAAKKLLDLGYDNTLDFKAGKRWWQHAGLELEK